MYTTIQKSTSFFLIIKQREAIFLFLTSFDKFLFLKIKQRDAILFLTSFVSWTSRKGSEGETT